MKIKSSMALVGMGVMGTLLYQSIKNGDMKKLISKMDKAKMKMVSDMEEMM